MTDLILSFLLYKKYSPFMDYTKVNDKLPIKLLVVIVVFAIATKPIIVVAVP